MAQVIETAEAVVSPHELVHHERELHLGGLSVGASLVVLSKDYDVVITRCSNGDTVKPAMSDAPVHRLLGTMFMYGIGDPMYDERQNSFLQAEWFTSLPAVNRTANEYEISDSGWRLSQATDKSRYTARLRFAELCSNMRMLVPSYSAEEVLASRQSGIIAGTLLMPPEAARTVQDNASVFKDKKRQALYPFMERVREAVGSYGLAIGAIDPYGLSADLEREVENKLYDKSLLIAGDLHNLVRQFVPKGALSPFSSIAPMIAETLNGTLDRLKQAQNHH